MPSVCLILAAALLAGCGMVLPSGTPPSDEGGMGLPAQIGGERYHGEDIPFAAELTVADNGCAYLDFDRGDMLAIWPQGSELSQPVRLPDGTELADGDIVEGIGTVVAFGALPGGSDGYWAHVTGFCAGQLPQALVVTQVSEVR